jgi:sulfur relay (sulfurtransferase) DsrF/TusC family protein
MGAITIILRRPPYGAVDAAEAIRHALGGVTEEVSVNLVLVDSGVHAARTAQDTKGSEYMNVAEGIGDCIDMGVTVYAERLSLKEQGLDASDLVGGVVVAAGHEIAEVISDSDTTMIF